MTFTCLGVRMRWRSVSVTSSTPKIGVVPRRGEGVERGRGSKRMEEDSRGQEFSVFRFQFSVSDSSEAV